jgi:hypothetical protein
LKKVEPLPGIFVNLRNLPLDTNSITWDGQQAFANRATGVAVVVPHIKGPALVAGLLDCTIGLPADHPALSLIPSQVILENKEPGFAFISVPM